MKYLDEIDKYLINALSQEEISKFDQRLEEDFELRQEFEFRKAIRQASIELEGRRIKSFLQEKPKRRIFTLWPKVAAAIAASVTIILLFEPNKASDQRLFEEYANTTSTFSIENSEGESFNFESRGSSAASSVEWAEKVNQAEKQFNDGEYFNTKVILENLLNSTNKRSYPELTLMYSIAQLKTGEVAKAKENLEYLAQLNLPYLKNQINYNLAFACLKTGDRKEARRLLKTVAESRGILSIESSRVLKQLKRFSFNNL